MRPVRLELEGFGAFRDRTEIDFDDIDFFALVGPTGSGKSTVIDAICFALYGSVPRYGDERLVGSAMSVGHQETRVRLDLRGRAADATRPPGSSGGTGTAGSPRRRPGWSRPTARVLAGRAKEMAPAVEQLLGLPFEHFTRCVVLPQGEFARFLHDRPADRQELLVALLDLGVYERVAQEANRRAAAAEAAVRLADQQLDGLRRRHARGGGGRAGAGRAAGRAAHRARRGRAAPRQPRRRADEGPRRRWPAGASSSPRLPTSWSRRPRNRSGRARRGPAGRGGGRRRMDGGHGRGRGGRGAGRPAARPRRAAGRSRRPPGAARRRPRGGARRAAQQRGGRSGGEGGDRRAARRRGAGRGRGGATSRPASTSPPTSWPSGWPSAIRARSAGTRSWRRWPSRHPTTWGSGAAAVDAARAALDEERERHRRAEVAAERAAATVEQLRARLVALEHRLAEHPDREALEAQLTDAVAAHAAEAAGRQAERACAGAAAACRAEADEVGRRALGARRRLPRPA